MLDRSRNFGLIGQSAQLAYQTQFVGDYVGFGDQLSCRLVCGHDGVANLPTGRLDAARRPLMRAGHGVEGPDVVAVGEEFLDGVVDVGGKRQGSWS